MRKIVLLVILFLVQSQLVQALGMFLPPLSSVYPITQNYGSNDEARCLSFKQVMNGAYYFSGLDVNSHIFVEDNYGPWYDFGAEFGFGYMFRAGLGNDTEFNFESGISLAKIKLGSNYEILVPINADFGIKKLLYSNKNKFLSFKVNTGIDFYLPVFVMIYAPSIKVVSLPIHLTLGTVFTNAGKLTSNSINPYLTITYCPNIYDRREDIYDSVTNDYIRERKYTAFTQIITAGGGLNYTFKCTLKNDIPQVFVTFGTRYDFSYFIEDPIQSKDYTLHAIRADVSVAVLLKKK